MIKFFMAAFMATFVAPIIDCSQVWALEVQELTTKKGIKVWFVQDKTSDIISLQGVFKNAGRIQDPDNKLGLSDMATDLMTQGTKDLDYKSFTRKMEELSINKLEIDADDDHILITLQTLAPRRDQAFALLKDTLIAPRFDDVQIQALKEQTIAQIQEDAREPGKIASKELKKLLFPSAPYGRDNDGTLETIQGITKEDLENFIKTRFSKDSLIIGICGNLTPDEVTSSIDDLFGDLKESSALPKISVPALKLKGEVKEIPWDVPQTIVKFADGSISPKDPDFYAAYVLFTLLGGGFESRLMQEVRVKRGFTYSISVAPLALELAPVFSGGFASKAENAGEAVRVIGEVWKDLIQNGPSVEEIEKAKDHIINSYVLGFSETKQVASQLVIAQLTGRTSDYFNKRNDIFKAITLEDVKRVIKRVLNTDTLTFVKVGKEIKKEETK